MEYSLDFDIKLDASPKDNVANWDFDPEDKKSMTTDSISKQALKNNDMQSNVNNAQSSEFNNNEKKSSLTSAFGIFSLSFWQFYFNIDQYEIKERLLACINPVSDKFSSALNDKYDLYGPFWIANLLIFLLITTGHFTKALSSILLGSSPDNQFNFDSISAAITLVYGALILFPSIFVGMSRTLGSELPLMSCVCIYGYSLVAYLVAALICIIPSSNVRWLAMSGACGHSMIFLLTNLKRYIEQHSGDYKTATFGLIGLTQVFLTITFMIKFY